MQLGMSNLVVQVYTAALQQCCVSFQARILPCQCSSFKWWGSRSSSSHLMLTIVGGMQTLAVALQSRVSEVMQVDIHPAAQLGRGMLVDHATGVVIGETAIVGDNVSLLHQVTLGGSGTGKGKRHPSIGEARAACDPQSQA